ncbi:MAG: type II secretion system protein GspD [Candidatus Binatia bacterium]
MASADLLAQLDGRRWRLPALVLVALSAGGAGWFCYGRYHSSWDDPLPVAPVAVSRAVEEKPQGLVNRSVGQWLEELAEEAGRTLVISADLAEQELSTMPSRARWRDRLGAYSRVAGFSYRVGDEIIEVGSGLSPPTTEAKGGTASTEAAEPGQPPAPVLPVTMSMALRFARASDVGPSLAKLVAGGDALVVAEPVSNSLLFRGKPEAVESVRRTASELDRPRKAFLLQARIVELSRRVREELGIEWKLQGTVGAEVELPAAATPGSAAGLLLATTGRNAIEARLGALEAEGRVRIVSRPQVMILDGGRARIESVRILRVRLPDRAAVVATTGQTASGSNRAVEEIPVGVSMEVEPFLVGGDRVLMRIEAKSSTLGPPQPPDGIPEEFSRVLAAEVVVGGGETAVLGGLKREGRSNSGSGVPLLRDLPVLGPLFGKRDEDREAEELLILVTPTVLG